METKREMPSHVPDDVRLPFDTQEPHVIDLTGLEEDDARVLDLTRYDWADSAAPPGSTPVGKAALRHFKIVGYVLVLLDVICLATGLLAAHLLRFGVAPEVDYLTGIAAAAVLWVAVFHGFGLYTPHNLSGLEEFRRAISAVGIGILLVVLLTFWFDIYLSRSWIALTLVITVVLEVVARRFVRAHEHRLRARGELVVRTILVGSRKDADEPLRAIETRDSGYQPIGFIDVTKLLASTDNDSVLERVSRLRAVFRRHQPDCVLIASPTIGTGQMIAVMQAARQEGVLVRVYTHLSGIFSSRLTVQPVGKNGIALTLKPATLSRTQRICKRGMDIVLSGIGLIVMSPVLLVAALAVKMTSRGPLFFRQQRVTQSGQTFTMYKLRTMLVDGEYSLDRRARDTSVPFFKHKSDPRLTKVGPWLRRWSVDELPQLVNVLRGELSLVGPRALSAEQVDANIELLGPRHEVRAGITGWWQIHGRSDVDPEDAVRMDQFYIENWSPALDAYILLKTVGAVLKHRGAY
jgi:exopolysaccharide biosynthesis polyprenyl glycosylphosphotransferase